MNNTDHSFVGGIYKLASEHLKLKVHALEAGKWACVGMNLQGRDCVGSMSESQRHQNCSFCGVFPACSGQYLSKVNHGKTYCCKMDEWFFLKDEQYWH